MLNIVKRGNKNHKTAHMEEDNQPENSFYIKILILLIVII